LSTDSERGAIIKVYPLVSTNVVGYLVHVVTCWMVLWFVASIAFDSLHFPMVEGNTAKFGYISGITGIIAIDSLSLPVVMEEAAKFGYTFMAAGIVAILLNARIRFIIRENGIESYSFLNVVLGKLKPPLFSTWANLSSIDVVQVDAGENGYHYVHLLYLKHPPEASINIDRIFPMKYRTYSTGRLFNKRSFYTVDSDRLVSSPFGKYLQRYAPHVIETAIHEQRRIERHIAEIESRSGS
jgi:hypothetical protein